MSAVGKLLRIVGLGRPAAPASNWRASITADGAVLRVARLDQMSAKEVGAVKGSYGNSAKPIKNLVHGSGSEN